MNSKPLEQIVEEGRKLSMPSKDLLEKAIQFVKDGHGTQTTSEILLEALKYRTFQLEKAWAMLDEAWAELKRRGEVEL